MHLFDFRLKGPSIQSDCTNESRPRPLVSLVSQWACWCLDHLSGFRPQMSGEYERPVVNRTRQHPKEPSYTMYKHLLLIS